MGTRLFLLMLALGCAGGALFSSGFVGTPASAAPVVSTRITDVSGATVGSNAIHIEIKAKCAVGWNPNFVEQRLIVKEAVTTGYVTAFTNFFGSAAGWVCDGQDHALTFDLPADGPWQPGALQASLDSTVVSSADSAVQAADSARKSLRLR